MFVKHIVITFYYVFYKHTTKYLDLFKKLNSLSNQLVQLIIDTDSTDTVYTVYILIVYQALLCSYFLYTNFDIHSNIICFFLFCFFTQSSCPDKKLSLFSIIIHVPIKLSENVPSLLETQCYVQVPCRMI